METRPNAPILPLSCDPSCEVPEENEAKTVAGMMDSLRGISETTFKHSGHPIRSVHAESHGLLRGELRVLEGLPAELAQGIFATPGSWPVVMRLSTVPGDILDDSVSAPRGMAIKVVGVVGERPQGSESATTQGFVLVNGRTFAAPARPGS